MNLKRIESFLNKNFKSSRTEDNLVIYDLGENFFAILGSGLLSFHFKESTCDFSPEDISGMAIVDNRLNVDFLTEEDSEKTLSINLDDSTDYFISEKLKESVFKIDVDDNRIKRLFVRATDRGTALRFVKDQYPEIAVIGVSKFSESKAREDLYVNKEAVSDIFQVYSDPETDRIIRVGIDWTMSNLFGSNWPSVL